MELWIRTQDKMRLVKPRRLAIKQSTKSWGGDWYIYESENSLRYGTYSTLDKCLNIFNEIEDLLNTSIETKKHVYQMLSDTKEV